ncbi:hypothetical protein Anas_06949 [Armadillidium nasatum]|uniref:Uncharacterized protein n=1 Tax=Armadillidium nasatum TaxID=96803 RepID=A0A5N5T1T9_9CRUS|nr:hypothetical protein Anas_06949 [Armadillidium nasatum]
MNPPSETPESNVNGTPSAPPAPGSALKTRTRQKKAPELQAVEKRNWLIHLLYVKKDFEQCKKIIQLQLEDTRGMCEYANYVQV